MKENHSGGDYFEEWNSGRTPAAPLNITVPHCRILQKENQKVR